MILIEQKKAEAKAEVGEIVIWWSVFGDR